MDSIKRHSIQGLPPSMSPSSHAVETDGFVFLTGQFGRYLDAPAQPLPVGIVAQTEQTLWNMRFVLKKLGLSLENVVSARVYLTHFKRDYDAMNDVYAQFFVEGKRPTRTCVGVTELVRDALIEIDCVAKR